MKRLPSSFIICPLIVIVLFVSGCSSDEVNTATHVAQCMGAITVEIAAVVVGDPVGVPDVIGVASVCISAAVAAFNPPSDTPPSSPEVTIHTSPQDSVAALKVDSNTKINCTTHTSSIRFNFSISFVMYVGDASHQSKYSSSPTGFSNNDLIAQKLFQMYKTDIGKNISLLSIVQEVPPKSQMQLHMPIQLSYKNGAAQVVNNGNTAVLPWLFTDGYKQAGAVTFTGSTASNCR